MSYIYDEDRVKSQSPSKRWSTTSGAAQLDVLRSSEFDASAVAGRKQKLRESKLNSTRGSISFGHEKVDYVSDCHSNQANALRGEVGGESREETRKRIKDMKANLTTTNFCLGDERVDYQSTNREAMKTCENVKSSEAKPALNKELKEAIKRSSLHFGNEPVKYSSVAHDGFVDKSAGHNVDLAGRKKELKEMKLRLTKHNFSLGEEPVDYTSDYNSGFGPVAQDSETRLADKKLLKAQIEDIRKCHFTLGHDKVLYQSDAQRAQKMVSGHKASDVAKALEHSKAMKAALQKTSICIGDDEEYM